MGVGFPRGAPLFCKQNNHFFLVLAKSGPMGVPPFWKKERANQKWPSLVSPPAKIRRMTKI